MCFFSNPRYVSNEFYYFPLCEYWRWCIKLHFCTPPWWTIHQCRTEIYLGNIQAKSSRQVNSYFMIILISGRNITSTHSFSSERSEKLKSFDPSAADAVASSFDSTRSINLSRFGNQTTIKTWHMK